MKNRREEYEKKQAELVERCRICTMYNSPTPECCDFSCSTGRRLRWLETEFADITGWSHGKWRKEV